MCIYIYIDMYCGKYFEKISGGTRLLETQEYSTPSCDD